MKPYARGKNICFREVTVADAEFILKLRTDPQKSQHLSATPGDVEAQRDYIAGYIRTQAQYYFIIEDNANNAVGTVRIYDIQGDSFCWGSWILSDDAPRTAAVESSLLIYDFGFFALHYRNCHFDVRKDNVRVVDFHKRFGAKIVREDDINFYFEYSRDEYLAIREKYKKYIL